MAVRPPQEDSHVPTDGENETFRGTNPWSGPFFVAAIMVGVLLFVAGIVIAVIWQMGVT